MTEHRNKESLEQEIESQEKLIASLEKEQKEARARLSALRTELANLEEWKVTSTDLLSVETPSRPTPKTADEKISLFRALFRGREDVFPRFWVESSLKKQIGHSTRRRRMERTE